MKKYLIYLSFLVFPLWAVAQDTPISKLFDKYASDPAYGSIDIKANATSFTWEKELENTELKDLMNEIDAVRILHTDKDKANTEKFIGKVYKTLSRGDYTELATLNGWQGGSAKMYMLKGEGNIVKEFTLAGTKDGNAFLFSISGNMDMQKLLSKDMMAAFGQLLSHSSKMHNCNSGTDSE